MDTISVQINLAQGKDSYTTGEKLEGVAYITAETDITFDTIDVEFLGTCRTRVEFLSRSAAVSSCSRACQEFLKLQQPGLEQHYPDDKVLRRGKCLACPFDFIIPQQLLPNACQHRVATALLRDAHLQLPPSLGGEAAAECTSTKIDDGPNLASIVYQVSVKVCKAQREGHSFVNETIASKSHSVCVKPVSKEQPPLDVSGPNTDYIMQRERGIRQSWYNGRFGTLKIEAEQPPPLRLRAGDSGENQRLTTAKIVLRFSSMRKDEQPPKLNSLSSKLKGHTYISTATGNNFPDRRAAMHDLTQFVHSEQVKLSSHCVTNVQWTKDHFGTEETYQRQDSAQSGPPPTEKYCDERTAERHHKSRHTAILQVPITLPANTDFVPTFHSCLISRIYQLKLELRLQGWHIPGSMDLKVPLQILCEDPRSTETPHHDMKAGQMVDENDEAESNEFEYPTLKQSTRLSPRNEMRGSGSGNRNDSPMGISENLPDYKPPNTRSR